MLSAYYKLTKPGIIYGNVMTAAAGFLLASGSSVDWQRLLVTLAGTALIIGGACVINNYLDRGIDTAMARTNQRALVRGDIPAGNALVFAAVILLTGFVMLASNINLTTVLVGAIGVIFYLVMYSIGKRRSVYGTIIGSVAGATPITAGYVAAHGSFDPGAALVFSVLAAWQMPHFYAIALFRLDDYRAAGLPVWPAKKGLRATKRQIIYFICAFMLANILLTAFNYTGYVFLIVMTFFGFAWLRLAREGFKTKDTVRWARKMFGFSLTVLLILSALLALEVVLP